MKKSFALAVPLLIAATPAAWIVWPCYIDLRIQVAPQAGGTDFWSEQQYASFKYTHETGTLWLHRQVGTAYPQTHGWTSAPEILAFFDTQLRQRGWSNVVEGGNNSLLPESRFVDKSMIRTYTRPDDDEPHPRIFVAAWPVGGVSGFHVVLVTANPSPLFHLAHGFQ